MSIMLAGQRKPLPIAIKTVSVCSKMTSRSPKHKPRKTIKTIYFKHNALIMLKKTQFFTKIHLKKKQIPLSKQKLVF